MLIYLATEDDQEYGYHMPVAIFSTLDKAVEARKELSFDWIDVYELDGVDGEQWVETIVLEYDWEVKKYVIVTSDKWNIGRGVLKEDE